jgi:hypothetical protein
MEQDNIFCKEELRKLPLFYHKMDKMKTSDVKELHRKDAFTISECHQAKQYRVVMPTIPFSNIVISHDK